MKQVRYIVGLICAILFLCAAIVQKNDSVGIESLGGTATDTNQIGLQSNVSSTSTSVEKKAFIDALNATDTDARIKIKSEEFVKIKSTNKKQMRAGSTDIKIEILDIQSMDGGIVVFARAWTMDDTPIGFGPDGSVETERFRIFDPPVLVEDPAGEVNHDYVDRFGVTTTIRYTYDPNRAIEQIISDNVRIVGKTGTKVIPGTIGNTTSTFYPNHNPETVSVDGKVQQGGGWINTWANTRNSATAFVAFPSGTSGEFAGTFAYTTSGNWNEMYRSAFLFDTSGITDTDTINSATLSVFVSGKADPNSELGITACTSSPASNTDLTTSDWQTGTRFGETHIATDISYGSITTSAYNDLTLNATGIAQILVTGVTKLGIRSTQDIDNSSPTWSSSVYKHVTGAYADDGGAGTTNDPKLVVVTTAGSTPTPTTTPVFIITNNIELGGDMIIQ